MAQIIVNASEAGYILGYGTFANTYPNPTIKEVHTDTVWIGPSGGNYYLMEGFVNFDTSVLSSYTLTAVEIRLFLISHSDPYFPLEIRLRDWGDTLTTADWVPAGAASTYLSCPLLATKSSLGSVEAYQTYTSESIFLENINTTGKTRLVLGDGTFDGHVGVPSFDASTKYYGLTADKYPQLVITIADPPPPYIPISIPIGRAFPTTPLERVFP